MQRLLSQKVSGLVNPAPLKHILGLGTVFVPMIQDSMRLTGSALVEGASHGSSIWVNRCMS